jgi:hypothetical protein
MSWFDIFWVLPEFADNIEDSNVEHIAQHGLTMEDVEHALEHTVGDEQHSPNTSRKIQTGFACDGGLIDVVYEWIDEITIYPITAYRLEDE